jgi:putative NADPH-quinone reductase
MAKSKQVRRIVIVQGHPHDGPHFCQSLSDSYQQGAEGAGHSVRQIRLADMQVEILRNPEDMMTPPPALILDAQKSIRECDHLVVVFPLWLGAMPALTKAFFEQLARNGFLLEQGEGWPRQQMKGRSARVVVTMGMPTAAFLLAFGKAGAKSFETGVLGMSGFKPVAETLIGGVGDKDHPYERNLIHLHDLGAKAA